MKRVFPLFLLLLTLLFAQVEVKAAPRQDSPRTAAEIIRLINEYRDEIGLPAFVQNSILMGTAQDASDYQAAIGHVTHEGPGGSRPRDRAYAAGYGDGKIIVISEIIYGYTFGTPEDAVEWWKTSEIHNNTMISPQYQDIGAGVAVANDRYYFTSVVGWISIYDNPDSTPTSGPSPTPSNTPKASSTTASNPTQTATKTPSATPSPSSTSIPASPTATWTAGPSPTPSHTPTPLPEGMIVHTVKSGDTLSLIAARYGLSLDEILALNNLSLSSLIFPGDIILIQAAPTATATQSPTATAAETNTSTPSPSATSSSTPTATFTVTPTPSATATNRAEEKSISPLPTSSPPPDILDVFYSALENTEFTALIAVGLFSVALVPIGILSYLFENRRR